MAKLFLFISTIFGLLIFNSCKSPECKSTNDVFNKYSPDKKEYKDELIRVLSDIDKSKLSYWMGAYWTESYKTGNWTEHIRVHIKGDGLCADMILTIGESRKGIENVLKTKSLGYKGAELEDLKFDIHQDSSMTEFVFREISGIRD